MSVKTGSRRVFMGAFGGSGAARAAAGVVLSAAVGGCRSYTPAPLDADAHRAAFMARTPAGAEVGEFARSLGEGGAPVRAFDVSDGISLGEAEVVALVYNGGLRRARARAGVTGASAAHAGLWEDPVLGTDLTRIIQGTPHPWKVMTSVGFTIPISGRLEAEKERAGAEHGAELARVMQEEWETRVKLRRAWSEWESASRRVGVLSEVGGRLEGLGSIVESLERAGEVSRVEAGLFRLELATGAVRLAQARSDVREWEQALRGIMGLPPGADVSFVAGEPTAGVAGEIATLTAQATARSVVLQTAREEYVVAERRLAEEIRRQYPDLQIGPGYGREDGEDQVLLGLSIPLPLLNRNQRGIAEAEAGRDEARAAYEAAAEGVMSELGSALARYEGAAARRRALEETLAPLVDQQYADARKLADLGQVDVMVLLETLSRQHEAKITLLEAKLAERTAAIEVEALVGPEAEPTAGETGSSDGGRAPERRE